MLRLLDQSVVKRPFAYAMASKFCSLLFAIVALGNSHEAVHAQIFAGTGLRQVGGVSIDASGSVRDALQEDSAESLQQLRDRMGKPDGDFAKPAKTRLISLKRLQQAMKEAGEKGEPLSVEMSLLGGLTRIEMIMVYPESQDIVIAGPAEPWTITKDGSVVGQESGRPIVYLDDLITALQSVDDARTKGISCSIDPTEQGSQRLNALLDNVQIGPSFQPASLEPSMREAFGPQVITLQGLPRESHMARIIFAADYQMKRLGMNLAKAPVKGMPSYIEMIRNKPVSSPQSRWWMACDYDAVQHSPDRLTWKISGRGIKTLTEQEVISKEGQRTSTGKPDAIAQKWADNFTDKLDQLSTKMPIFGDLRNVMDTCVIAAIIRSQELEKTSGLDLSILSGKTSSIELSNLQPPTQVDPQCSFLKTSAGWVVTASGGVMVDSWTVAQSQEVNDSISATRSDSIPSTSWTW